MRGKKKLKVDESKVLNKDLISQESTDRENKSAYKRSMYRPKTNRSKDKSQRITKSPIVIRNDIVKKVRFVEAENQLDF